MTCILTSVTDMSLSHSFSFFNNCDRGFICLFVVLCLFFFPPMSIYGTILNVHSFLFYSTEKELICTKLDSRSRK